MKRNTKSLIDNEPVCYFCKTPHNLHRHHCIPGYGRRNLSEQYGLWIWCCAEHHYMIHSDRGQDVMIRQEAQTAWEAKYGTREDFIKVFGRSWL